MPIKKLFVGVTTTTTTNPLLFRQSPVSTPVTPGGTTVQMSPRSIEDGGLGSDPIKIPVILPTGPISSTTSSVAATGSMVPPPPPPPPLSTGHAGSTGKPPPLPPKPARYHSSSSSMSSSHHPLHASMSVSGSLSQHHHGHQFHFSDSTPPLPPKDSSPPPPIPPRSVQPPLVGTTSLPYMRSSGSVSSGILKWTIFRCVLFISSR